MGIVFKNNEIQVGVLNLQQANRANLYNVSKTCKIHKDLKDEYEIAIKLTNKNLISIYTRDRDLKE